jgi:tetratricopeptide (TPR) repeat protein
LGKRYGFDLPALREATPTARFGNLIVFRGNFVVPGLLAEDRYWAALSKLYSEKPDISAGEALLRQSAALDPNAFYVNIHLGSVCLRRGSREDALVAYRAALEHAPEGVFRRQIEEQIRRVSVEPLNQIPELRDPIFE